MREIEERMKSYRMTRLKYESLKLELEEIESIINTITQDYSKPRVKTSIKTDKLAEMIDKLSEKQRKANETQIQMVQAFIDVTNLIEKLEDPFMREVMTRYYVSCEHWIEIAHALPYDYSGLHKIKRRAFDILERV